MEENTSTALTLPPGVDNEQIQKLTLTVTGAIEANNASLEKALAAANKALVEIAGTPADDSQKAALLDEKLKQLVDKFALTVKAMKERREPITRFFDEIRKAFTGMENKLGKDGEIIVKMHDWRDARARCLDAIEQARARERAEKAAREQELVDLRVHVKSAILAAETAATTADLAALDAIFNGITLQNYGTSKGALREYTPVTDAAPVIPGPALRRVTPEEYQGVINAVLPGEIARLQLERLNAVGDHRARLLARVDSRRAELVRLAEANEEERKRLEAGAAARRAEEAEKQRQQLLNFTETGRQAIETAKTGETLDAVFNQNYSPAAPDVKKTMQLNILALAGWGQIFMFWFEREGKTLPADKIEKFTLLRMKTFCEATVNKTGEMIDSPLVSYTELVKAR